MKTTRYLLIGGGLASDEAAKAIRQADAKGEITLVGDEEHPPYNRPPLSKEFVRGETKVAEILCDSADDLAGQGIELLPGHRVERLDTKAKAVTLADGQTIRFEKALLATGGTPIRLDAPGFDRPEVYYLRRIEDSEAIAAAAQRGRRAVIIGAGFIGMELAASLTQRGVEVTVVERAPQVWPRFTVSTLAEYVQRYVSSRGVRVLTGEQVGQIDADGDGLVARTKSGQGLGCDFVCVAVGIRPNVELAEVAGLKVDDGVVVDNRLRSSHPDIYAAGDIANYVDPVFDKRRRVEHWGQAEYTGQLAGRNLAGAGDAYELVTYVWSDLFDLSVEFAGDEREHDRTLARGTVGEKPFVLMYLKRGVLTAYFAVGVAQEELEPLQTLIRRKAKVADRQEALCDPDTPIASLV